MIVRNPCLHAKAKFPQCGGSIRVWIGVIAAIPATTVPGTTGILATEITTVPWLHMGTLDTGSAADALLSTGGPPTFYSSYDVTDPHGALTLPPSTLRGKHFSNMYEYVRIHTGVEVSVTAKKGTVRKWL